MLQAQQGFRTADSLHSKIKSATLQPGSGKEIQTKAKQI